MPRGGDKFGSKGRKKAANWGRSDRATNKRMDKYNNDKDDEKFNRDQRRWERVASGPSRIHRYVLCALTSCRRVSSLTVEQESRTSTAVTGYVRTVPRRSLAARARFAVGR